MTARFGRGTDLSHAGRDEPIVHRAVDGVGWLDGRWWVLTVAMFAGSEIGFTAWTLLFDNPTLLARADKADRADPLLVAVEQLRGAPGLRHPRGSRPHWLSFGRPASPSP